MPDPNEPDMSGFKAFFERYNQACRDRDTAFFRTILPSDIPRDQFDFVVDMSHQSTLDLDASGVEPKIVPVGNQMFAVYEGDLGDDMMKFTLDFYLHEGRWLKYDPNEPE